jgi:hypothetical protein
LSIMGSRSITDSDKRSALIFTLSTTHN